MGGAVQTSKLLNLQIGADGKSIVVRTVSSLGSKGKALGATWRA